MMLNAAAALAVAAIVGAAPLVLSADDRDALTRVAVAEAGNQGDSGVAAVVQTILNRVASGGWGATVQAVVDAPHQFEPVMRAGGDWRRLPHPTATQRIRVKTILTLIADGRMPDFIGGALYFQNPRVVASRVAAGTVSPGLLDFGARTPSAVVGDHAFYVGSRRPVRESQVQAPDAIFVARPPPGASPASAPPPLSTTQPASDERGLFILVDGRMAQDASGSPSAR